jgi:nucleoside-diphosphate-sugar epimerase
VFGSGRVRVQPIFVGDLVKTILALAASDRFDNSIIEAGGPEALTIEDLLRKLRSACGAGNYRAIHVPLRPVRAVLALLEPWFLPVLPFTAGQLTTFAFDGCAHGSDAPTPKTMSTIEEVARAGCTP